MYDKNGDGNLTFPELEKSVKYCKNQISIRKWFDDAKKQKEIIENVEAVWPQHQEGKTKTFDAQSNESG